MIKSERYLPSKGLNKDLGKTIFSSEYLYNLINCRISHNDDSEILTITNVKGTELIKSTSISSNNISVSFKGVVIGQEVIDKYLIIFSTNDNGDDYIYRFEYIDETNFKHKILYNGDLGFNSMNPIESIGNIESEDVIKVYWVDKINNPRYINIMKEDFIPNYPSQFNFVPELSLKEKVSIKKYYGDGLFHSGTIQYAFTYKQKNGAESNIFYTTGISFLSDKERANAKDETCENNFVITINNVQQSFDYLQPYALERHDLNSPVVVRQLSEVLINSTSLTIKDNGREGAIIDSNILLYIGGDDIHINSLATKDNHLFGADVELKRPHLKEVNDIIYNNPDKIKVEWSYKGLVTGEELKTINYSNSVTLKEAHSTYYDYNPDSLSYNTLEGNPIRFFKGGETYRFAIQGQYKNGVWSEAVYLGKDYTVPFQDIIQRESSSFDTYDDINDRKVIIENEKKIYLGIFPEVTVPKEIVNIFYSKGYRKLRLLYVPLDLDKRSIISQGLISNTIANPAMRKANRYYAYSDYIFRPQPIVDSFLKENVKTGNFWSLHSNKNRFSYNSKKFRKYLYSNYYQYFPNSLLRNISVHHSGFRLMNYTEIEEKKDISLFREPHPVGTIPTYQTPYNIFQYKYDSEKDERLVNGSVFESNWFIDANILNIYSPEFILNDDKDNVLPDKVIFKSIISLDKSLHNEIINTRYIQSSTSYIEATPKFASKGVNPYFTYLSKELEEELQQLPIISEILKEEENKNNITLNNLYSNVLTKFTGDTFSSIPNNDNGFLESRDWYLNIKPQDFLSHHIHRGLYFGSYYPFKVNVLSTKLKNSTFHNYNFPSSLEVGNKTYNTNVNELLTNLVTDANEDTLTNLKINTGILSYKSNSHIVTELEVPTENNVNKNFFVSKIDYNDKDNDKRTLELPFVLQKYGFVENSKIKIYEDFHIINTDSLEYLNYIDDQKYFYSDLINQSQASQLLIHKLTNLSSITATTKRKDSFLLCDLYIEKENQYSFSKKDDIYIPCSNAIDINTFEEETVITAQDGDTYLQRFDFIKTEPLNPDDKQQRVEAISYMTTSFINLDGRYDKYRKSIDLEAKHKGNYGVYNDAYSQLNNFFTYRTLDYDKLNDDKKSNSIIFSQQKFNQEITDKWLNLNMTSVYDLEGKYGKINKILNFGSNLFTFQDSGIARIIFNPRVQISTSDGTPIEIANSGKLEGHQYIAENIGCINKWSIEKSSSHIYFIDDLNRDIVRFGSNFENLTSQFGFRNWGKKFLTSKKEFNIKEYNNFTTHIDNVNNDVYFNNKYIEIESNNKEERFVEQIDKWYNTNYFQGSLVFNIDANFFESEFNFESIPFMFNFESDFIAIKNDFNDYSFTLNNMFKGERNNFFGKRYPSYIDYLISSDYSYNKIFNSIIFKTEVYKNNQVINLTVDEIMGANEYQFSKLDLIHFDTDNTYKISKYLDKKFNTWASPLPRNYKTLDFLSSPYLRLKLRFNCKNGEKLKFNELFINYTI